MGRRIMSTLNQPLTSETDTGEECVFEQRQSTPWLTACFTIFAILDFVAAIALLIVMITLDYWTAHTIIVDIMCFGVAFWIFYSAWSVRYCEIKDLGTKLSVKLGPSTGLYSTMGSALIAYDEIASYEDPTRCCENCCGLCVSPNPCGCFGGLRGLGMRSTDCSQRIVIITFKKEQSVIYSGRAHKYKRIAISVEARNYSDFTQLLDRKCFFDDA